MREIIEFVYYINRMPTCGFIKVQPDGLKEKAAKSTQKWDPVSKRMVNIYDNPPIITMLNNWNLNYNLLTALWSQSKEGSVELQVFTNTTNSIVGATPVLSAIIVNEFESTKTYVTNYTSVFRNFYFFTIRPTNYNISPNQSAIYQLNWYVNSWMPESVGGVSSTLVRGIAIDGSGNTYSSDTNGGRIIKTTSSGVSTVLLSISNPLGLAVNSNILYITNSSDTLRRYNLTTGVFMADIIIDAAIRALVIDSQNNIYVQGSNGVIRKRTPDGTITTILIKTGGPCGTSMSYYRDAVNNEYIYYTETTNYVVNRTLVLQNGVVPVPTGIINTIAGNGTSGYNEDGATGTSAQLNAPRGVSVDSVGNIYIADTFNNRIRKVNTTTGIITTVAGNGTFGYSGDGATGTSAQLRFPAGVSVDSVGNMYIADTNSHRIRKVDTTGIITTVAGNGTFGYSGDGLLAISAQLRGPNGVSVDSVGNIYIADTLGHRIRMVSRATQTKFGISMTADYIYTIAGTGAGGYNGDGATGTSVRINAPHGVSVDSDGNIYIADTSNHRIRKVDTTGIITTVAGTGTSGYNGDGATGTSARLNKPEGVSVDSVGNIYIAEASSYRIRKVDTTGIITTIAGTGTPG